MKKNEILCLLPDRRVIPISKVSEKCCPIAIQLNKGTFIAVQSSILSRAQKERVSFYEMRRIEEKLVSSPFIWRLPTLLDVEPLVKNNSKITELQKQLSCVGQTITNCFWLKDIKEGNRYCFDLRYANTFLDGIGVSWECRFVTDVIKSEK